VNAIIDAGLAIERLAEPSPTPQVVAQNSQSPGELIRPALLVVRAHNHAGERPVAHARSRPR
jgi:hypothetical protein